MHSAFCTLPSLCAFCTKEYAACTLPSLYAFCTPCTFYTLPSLCNTFCTTEYAAHTLPYLAIHFAHCPPYAMNSALKNMVLLRILPDVNVQSNVITYYVIDTSLLWCAFTIHSPNSANTISFMKI